MRSRRMIPASARQLLEYDPATGALRWLVDHGKSGVQGQLAGFPDKKGYLVLSINGTQYKNHRVAWFLYTGKQPPAIVDHRDRVKNNNAWLNLREADHKENGRNARHRVQLSGVRGVYRSAGKSNPWRVALKVGDTSFNFGCFADIELAALVAEEARAKYHGGFAT